MEENAAIKIRRFDVASSIHQDNMVLIIGKRATGKTTLVKELLYHRYKTDGIPYV